MKFGFLCSCGGSALYSALDILFPLHIINKSDIKILTDRHCGAVDSAKDRSLNVDTIEWTNSTDFSLAALKYFYDCDIVVLLFTRIVDKSLFENIPTLNIHPSLLPSFKGFKPLEQAINCGVKFFGSTLHMVNKECDGGQIIAQVINPLPNDACMSFISKISYLQKTYLVLLSIDLVLNNALTFYPKKQNFTQNFKTDFSCFANPRLITSAIQDGFNSLYEIECSFIDSKMEECKQ